MQKRPFLPRYFFHQSWSGRTSPYLMMLYHSRDTNCQFSEVLVDQYIFSQYVYCIMLFFKLFLYVLLRFFVSCVCCLSVVGDFWILRITFVTMRHGKYPGPKKFLKRIDKRLYLYHNFASWPTECMKQYNIDQPKVWITIGGRWIPFVPFVLSTTPGSPRWRLSPGGVKERTEMFLKTLPEAQRTQGIESIPWIMFLTEIDLK